MAASGGPAAPRAPIAVTDDIRAGFSGQLVGPDDEHYDELRRLHNGMIDKRPSLIARCLDTADVVAAVTLGPRHG